MTLLAPWMFAAGVTAALGVVALHLLTTRRPPPALLPTARFVPESDVRAVSRASRPTDLLLLALRALAVLAIGAAFARPVPDAPGPRVRTVVALEWTRAVADTAEARRAARTALGAPGTAGTAGTEGTALVVFDSSARVMRGDPLAALDALGALTGARGDLSPVFIAALDAARSIARGADSVRLVVVSAMEGGALDAATVSLRDSWPGRVEFVRLTAAADTARSPRPSLVTSLVDDPLAPALDRLPARRGGHTVRIVRPAREGSTALGDREVASGGLQRWTAGGGVVILWPRASGPSVPDAVTAFGAGAPATLVAPLARLAVPDGRVIARWRDGTPAATESAVGEGCLRQVGIGLPLAGDVTLRRPFAELLAVLVEPCGGARALAIPDSALAWLTADGPLAAGSALAGSSGADRSLSLALLIGAGLLLVAEQLLRRRPAREVAA